MMTPLIKPWATREPAVDKAQEVGGRVQGVDHGPDGSATGYVVIGAASDVDGSAIFHEEGLAYYLELSADDQRRVEGR